MVLFEVEGQVDFGDLVFDSVMNLQGVWVLMIEEVFSYCIGLLFNVYDNILEVGCDIDDVCDWFVGVDLICLVGSCYIYQNVVFVLVEEIMECVIGQFYDSLVDISFFEWVGLFLVSIGFGVFQSEVSWVVLYCGW